MNEIMPLSAPTLAQAFRLTAASVPPERVALRSHDGARDLTWPEYAAATARVAAGLAGLADLGLVRPAAVGLLLPNVAEFHIIDAAAIQLGLPTCSLYPTMPAAQARFIIDDADCRVLVTDSASLSLARQLAELCPGLVRVLVIDPQEGELPEFVSAVPGLADTAPFEPPALAAVAVEVRPDDTLSLVYTSGTTGPPKGVRITHRNAMAVARGFLERVPLPDGCRLVSYLPMAHVAERASSHWLPMVLGASVTCCPEQGQLAGVLSAWHPQWFFGVPRVWEKIEFSIRKGLAAAPEAFQETVRQGLALGEKITLMRQDDRTPAPEELAEYEALSGQALRPILQLLGLDTLVAAHSGAAPIAPRVLMFFHALGIPLGQIWGMTELCAAACVSEPGQVRLHTVGPPLPGVELRVAEDGEVLVRGDLVMPGYHNRPGDTAATIDQAGWLHTGDLGHLTGAGELAVTGRSKELIINSYGKNMSPATIEVTIKAMVPLISQLCCIGDGRPYNVGLATIDADALPPGAETLHPELISGLLTALREANQQVSAVERIRRVHILASDWVPGGDELTPSMKLRRAEIAKKYQPEIDAIYAGDLGFAAEPSLRPSVQTG